jgi:hypothetical protein
LLYCLKDGSIREKAHGGKEKGRTVEKDLFALGGGSFCGLHLLPLPLNLPDQGIFTLKARIEGVSEPDPREIIKAMAEAAECGSHCCGQ